MPGLRSLKAPGSSLCGSPRGGSPSACWATGRCKQAQTDEDADVYISVCVCVHSCGELLCHLTTSCRPVLGPTRRAAAWLRGAAATSSLWTYAQAPDGLNQLQSRGECRETLTRIVYLSLHVVLFLPDFAAAMLCQIIGSKNGPVLQRKH